MPRHPNPTPYDNSMNVFKQDPRRDGENRSRNALTTRPSNSPRPSSSYTGNPSTIAQGGSNAGFQAAPFNAPMLPQNVPIPQDFAPFFGRLWTLDIVFQNQIVRRTTFQVELNNDISGHSPYPFLWAFTGHGPWKYPFEYDYQQCLARTICRRCQSEIRLYGPN